MPVKAKSIAKSERDVGDRGAMFASMLRKRKIPEISLPSFPSDSFDFDSIARSGFKTPFVVLGTSRSFGIKLPPSGFTIQQVAELVGRSTPVRIIDVDTQSEITHYNIGQYADYLMSPERLTGKTLNMISLEVSQTELGDMLSPPRFVNQIDWIYTVWPLQALSSESFSRVQKYCLAGMAGSYTDFHIDFGGTSVWYHIIHGRKRFYLIPPTVQNLLIFEKWTCRADQSTIFLGDLVEQCYFFDLTPGKTLIIPSGWIHSVYTPEDSLVFGGNFLHSYSILPQLQADLIETRTRVNKAYKCPQFKPSHYHFLTQLLPKAQHAIQTNTLTPWTAADDKNRDKASVGFTTVVANNVDRLVQHLRLPGVLGQIALLLHIFPTWDLPAIVPADVINPAAEVRHLVEQWWALLEHLSAAHPRLHSLIAHLHSLNEVDLFSEDWMARIYSVYDDTDDHNVGDGNTTSNTTSSTTSEVLYLQGCVVHAYDVTRYDCFAPQHMLQKHMDTKEGENITSNTTLNTTEVVKAEVQDDDNNNVKRKRSRNNSNNNSNSHDYDSLMLSSNADDDKDDDYLLDLDHDEDDEVRGGGASDFDDDDNIDDDGDNEYRPKKKVKRPPQPSSSSTTVVTQTPKPNNTQNLGPKSAAKSGSGSGSGEKKVAKYANRGQLLKTLFKKR